MTGLSATLIVRDEARHIEGCLASLVPHVDEIVLVDTGSSDDTVERARHFPIALHRFAWRDDFALARNFAIEQARGDWILYIDADERLAVPSAVHLVAMLADPGKLAWHVRFAPRLDSTPYAELRLFRRDPRIRFRGAIHESVLDSVAALAGADPGATGDSEVAIQHLGYEADQAYKNERNIPLLRARLACDPGHLFSWWHLGQCLRLSGDVMGAVEAWRQGIALARAVPATQRSLGDAQCVVSLLKLEIGRGADATGLLEEALALYPDHLVLRWMAARLALERGDAAAALPVLEHLAAIDADSFFDRRVSYRKALFRHRAREALALCLFRLGRYADAAQAYRQAAPHAPDPQGCEIKARLAEARALA
jgi:cytochrome c-type biogenesis protein CcmH/NrfG